MVWRYLKFCPVIKRRDWLTQLIEVRAERFVLQMTIVLGIIAVVYGKMDQVVTFDSATALVLGRQIQQLPADRLAIVVMYLAAATSGVGMSSNPRWETLTPGERRDTLLRNATHIAVLFFGVVLVLTCFQVLQVEFHQLGGSLLFNEFGTNGNSAADLISGLGTLALSFWLFPWLGKLSRKSLALFRVDANSRAASTPPSASGQN